MSTFANRIGVAALVGLATWALTAAGTSAQQPGIFRPLQTGGLGPGSGVTAIGGGAFGVTGPLGPLANPYAGLVVNPAAAFNPYGTAASMSSTPSAGMPNPFYSYPPYYPYDPYYGYLRGAADVINAQGQFMISKQQALMMQEQNRQSRIDTRRRLFDEWLYERANTPTLQDERERLRKEEIRRSLNDPPITEIWSAKAPNDLLADLIVLHAKKIYGPQVNVEEDILKRINVIRPSPQGGNIGLLKNEGRLTWPPPLMEPDAAELRRNIDLWLREVMNQAANGRVDPGTLRTLEGAVKELNTILTRKVHDLTFNQYTQAKRFVNSLDEALKVLGQTDAGNYLTGKYAARGRTVQELVDNMARDGLVFAPAVAGDEGAYLALHRWLVAYHTAAKTLTAER